MSKYGVYALALAMCIWTLAGPARSEEAHDHGHHGHDLSGPELGLSAGYVHLQEEEENVLGVHAHLLKRLGDEGISRYFAIGLGAEYLFSDSAHYAAMLSFAAHPWRGLALSVSPGVQWAEHEDEHEGEHEAEVEAEYSTHIEATYVFPLGKYDIGPLIDYSWTKDEVHYMIGIHVGLHF